MSTDSEDKIVLLHGPKPIDLSELLDSLERLYMIQHERGFARPKPKLLEAGDERAADIPVAFLEWWKEHRNCDLSPVVAWRSRFYRNEYYEHENSRSRSIPF
jgi:hypothetical protein